MIDFGPDKGWTIKPQSRKNLDFRVKFKHPEKRVKVKIKAIANSERMIENKTVRNPELVNVIDPTGAVTVDQENPLKNTHDEKYLELATGRTANSYSLIKFDLSEISGEISKAQINLFQYWGSGYSDLRKSDVTVRIFGVSETWDEETVNWNSLPRWGKFPIDKKPIKSSGDWYHFNVTSHVKNRVGDKISFLLKFSEKNFDDKKRRIRFKSELTEKNPHLIIK